MSIKELPYTTVEQVLRFRTESIKQIDALTLVNNDLRNKLANGVKICFLTSTILTAFKDKAIAENIPCTCQAIKDMVTTCNAGNSMPIYMGIEPQEVKIPQTGWILTYTDCNCDRGIAVKKAERTLSDLMEISQGEPHH
jgi:hypothetical protein